MRHFAFMTTIDGVEVMLCRGSICFIIVQHNYTHTIKLITGDEIHVFLPEFSQWELKIRKAHMAHILWEQSIKLV